MSKELNCMNCSIGDFKHELCDCNNGFCKEFKSIGTQEDFFNAVVQRIRPEWIPVSERLPEVGSEVLVCFDFKGKRSVSISELYSDGKFHGFDDEYLTPEGRKYRKAVAWMPLPEPYKGGDTE